MKRKSLFVAFLILILITANLRAAVWKSQDLLNNDWSNWSGLNGGPSPIDPPAPDSEVNVKIGFFQRVYLISRSQHDYSCLTFPVLPGKRYEYTVRARMQTNIVSSYGIFHHGWSTSITNYKSSDKSYSSNYVTKSITAVINEDFVILKIWSDLDILGNTTVRYSYAEYDWARLRQVIYEPKLDIAEKCVCATPDLPYGSSTTVGLHLNDLSFADTPTDWSIDWGDGTVECFPELNAFHEHTYDISGGRRKWTATLYGSNQAGTVSDTVNIFLVTESTERKVPSEYTTIQAAIDDCFCGDIVIVAPGIYTGPGNCDIDFGGKPIIVRSTDPNDPNIVAATIIDCHGTKSEPHRGFYFHNDEGPNSVLSGLTITNGWADEGGGMYNRGSSPTITNCTFSENLGFWGGGVYCKTSNPIISNCIIKSNSASYDSGGGICCMEGSNPTIINCSITGNSSEGGGGGILCESHSSPTLTNCTIVGNTASYCCGGICCLDDSNVTITNSILWGNSPPAIVAKGSLITYSNVEGGRDGEGNIDEDPCFASDTDYHLICGSPCIDAANNTPDVNLPETDIEGRPRIIDGDNDTNPVIDMGAYEYNPNENAIVVSSRSLSFIQNWPGPKPITLLIGNRGSAELQWEIIIIEDCNWLQLSLTSGSSTGQITLTADTNGLEPGNYSCTLQIVDPNAINSPVDVNVTLPVGQLLRVPHDFNTIQQAIDASADNDIVLVADGVYTGSGNKNLDYKGKAITVRSENGPENCIIDCEGLGIGFSFHSAERENSIVQGFTITDGNDPSNPRRGGIIYCKQASPTINNCHIIVNMGDGIEAEYSDAIITNCTITDNPDRAGVRWGWGDITITNCIIRNNMFGITGNGGYSRISDCNISGNGSGIKVSGPTSTTIIVTDCTINGNAGAGIQMPYGSNSAIIRHCVISNNAGAGIFYRVEWYGGLLKISDSAVCYNANGGISIRENQWNRATISRCIIIGNTTNLSGGGIDCDESEALTVANCLIVGNYALYPGGGICARSNENISVVNCTIADNHSDFGGGGIFHDAWVSIPNALSGTIVNTILWGNTAGSVGPQIAFDSLPPPSSILAVSYCDIQDGQMGVYVGEGCTLDWSLGNIDANPCFVQPGYWDPNGTSDDANDDFWVDGDYHLKSEGWRWDKIRQRWDYDDVTSRCIDAGNPGCPLGDEPLTVPEDPDNIWGQNLRINMGAYGGTDEASMPPYGWALLADLTNDGVVNFEDYVFQALDWLKNDNCQPGDLNRDTLVDIGDIALLAEDWLK